MKDKRGMHYGWWILIGVVVVLVIGLIASYNSFVGMSQNVDGKWSEVESQYQRQADLIPNLISVVSSSVKVETNFVKEVILARTSWQNAASTLAKDSAGQQMNTGISALVSAVAESYPTLQANKQYIALTDELAGTQNRITVARGNYILAIQSYNVAIKRFPGNIVAGMFGFSAKEYYTSTSGINTPVIGNGTLP